MASLQQKIAAWQKRADDHQVKQMVNPFSNWDGATHRAKLNKSDFYYGKPLAGTKTEKRGVDAGRLVNTEICELCNVISTAGQQMEDGRSFILFADLFDQYTRISNKLVGMLLRARKYGLVSFEGEILLQKRDDNTVITLEKTPDNISNVYSNV